jgi:uncharacterized repeat protein (TIGR01451 family)
VNVDCPRLGTSAVGVRISLAGLALLAAACLFLAKGSHPHPAISQAPAASPFSPQAGSRSVPGRNPKLAHELLSNLPLIFEPNRGQANLDPSDPRARFVAHGSGYSLFLGSEGAFVTLRSKDTGKLESLQMKIAGSNPSPVISPSDRLPGKSHYILGNKPDKWRMNIPQYARVRYDNLYRGINLVFYGNHGRPEFDFLVAPGADPSQPQLEFSGAKLLKISDGALVVEQNGAHMRLDPPHVYQQIDGRQQTVEGHFVLRGALRAGFAVGPYDRSRELVIDPVPSFSTYFGGSGDELNTVVAVDAGGNIYLAGSTSSTNLPVTTGVFQKTLTGSQNVYIAKINPSISAIEYVTYLGGSGADSPAGIAVDGAGDAYLAGTTTSANFPVSSIPYQSSPEAGSTGTEHVFVTKLNPAATSPLIYSSYLSGSGNDVASGMTIDGSGNIYVTGTTTSTLPSDVGTPTGHQFPSTSLPSVPYQSSALAAKQFFVTEVSPVNSGSGSILYSTYFGGSFTPGNAAIIANGGGIAVDQNQVIYFSGTTNFAFTPGQAGSFPILNAYQPCLNQNPPLVFTGPPTCAASTNPDTDAFLAKLNPNATKNNQGPQLIWSTYLGSGGNESGNGVALDPGAANVYLVGTTNSNDVLIPKDANTAPFQPCLDNPTAVAGACPTGQTASDAFVARFPNLTLTSTQTTLQLDYFSYLGGSGNEAGLQIAADNSNGALITGTTTSTDFPTFPPGQIQTALTGTQDAFVARINTIAVTGANQAGSWSTYFGGSGPADASSTTAGTGIAIDVNQNTYLAGSTNATGLLVTVPKSQPGGSNAGGFDAFVTQLKSAAGVTISGVATLGNNQSYFSAGVPATFTYTITNTGPDLATGLTVTDNISQASTVVPVTFDSASAIGGICGGGSTNTLVTCTINSLQAGSTATVTVVLTPMPNANGSPEGFNGGTVQVFGQNNFIFAETTVPAQMSDFAISAQPSSYSVASAGLSAFYSIQITPHPVFGTSVSLSCTGNPPGSTCTFTPNSSIPLTGAGAAAATLTVSTTARPINTAGIKGSFGRFYAAFVFVPGLLLIGLSARKGKRRLTGFLLLGLLSLQLIPLPACSSPQVAPPPTGTPPGTYKITITGTAGSDSKSQVVLLTVP